MPQRLKTSDPNLKHRNGQTVRTVRTITDPSEGFEAEVLPMLVIRFGDGFQTEVGPDEVLDTPTPKRVQWVPTGYRS